MNEEEKKAIKFIKHDMFEFEEIDSSVLEEFNNVHKIILNLIEKQQEKIQSLENQLNFIGEQNKYIERQTIYLNKLEKELQGQRIEKEKMQKNYESVIDKMEYEMGYNYISKDKIRDKINEIKELQKTLATHEELDFQIKILEELLEEN